MFAARGGLPSHAHRAAVSAAFICPVPRTDNASPSSFESTGKGSQQQPSRQARGVGVLQRQLPAACQGQSRSQGLGLLPGPLPSTHRFSPCPSLPPSPRSFCWEHRPRQTAVTAPARGTTCVLCRQTVGNVASYHTLVCPACKHAWFHRACVQVGALPSPCRHAWCSAAPGTAHAHAACASRAAKGLE